MRLIKLILSIGFYLFIFSSVVSSQSTMKVHIPDVGQGIASIIEFECGVIMVDSGGEENEYFSGSFEIIEYLDEFYSRRDDLNRTIDLFVLSHPHIDHTRSARTIIDQFNVRNVITNGKKRGSGNRTQNYVQDEIDELIHNSDPNDDIGYYQSITDNLSSTGITSSVIDPINCGNNNDPIITVLWGTMLDDQDLSRTEYNNGNNHSIVMKIQYGNSSVLFPGDLEEEAIELLLDKYSGTDVLDVDVYVVSHHFSKNGTTRELLGALTPDIAVGGFGRYDRETNWTAWDYGHPNVDIVNMLEDSLSASRDKIEVWVGNGGENFFPMEITKAIYGTGWDGDIVLEATPNGDWTNITSSIFPDPSIQLININTANQIDLESLPQIGPSRAKAIIDYRNLNGSFTSPDELDSVPGIGQITINTIKDLIKF